MHKVPVPLVCRVSGNPFMRLLGSVCLYSRHIDLQYILLSFLISNLLLRNFGSLYIFSDMDEKAERCLSLALVAAEKTGFSTRGGNLRFSVSAQRAITDAEIGEYCLCWIDRVTPAPGIEVGWRPRVDAADLTVIQMLSKDLLQCQGRVETVHALAPIAASLACGIPPSIAMRCPSSAPFWDWCEKHRLRAKIGDRPITALCIPKDSNKNSSGFDPLSAPTSATVSEYVDVRFSDALRAQCVAAIDQLAERPLPNYLWPPTPEEANRLISQSMAEIARNYDGHFYMHAELANGSKITTGQLIFYCKQIWHDSELYHLATRWRPGYMPNAKTASKDGEKRGGIYIPDKANNRVSIMGAPSICQGLAPILAAIRIRMAPEIARKTDLFRQVFFDFMNWDPRRGVSEITCVTDVPKFSGQWDQRFAHEELMMGRALRVLMGTYNESQGQYQGITCFPNVVWSRDDFVTNLLLWWPHANIQQGPKFRFVPHFMDKGGLELEDGGNYISQQGKASSQGALMIMAASLACGIPAEIAALLQTADQFWAFATITNGPESVAANRARLRAVRDGRFGPEWHAKRNGLETTERIWAIDMRKEDELSLDESNTRRGECNWGNQSGQSDWGSKGQSRLGDWGSKNSWSNNGQSDWGSKEQGGWGGKQESSQSNWDCKQKFYWPQEQSSWDNKARAQSSWDYKPQAQSSWEQSNWNKTQGNWEQHHDKQPLKNGWTSGSREHDSGSSQSRGAAHGGWANQTGTIQTESRGWDTQSTDRVPQTSPKVYTPKVYASQNVSLSKLQSDFSFSGNVWAEVSLAKPLLAWQCAALLSGFGAAAVGACLPVWSIRHEGGSLVAACDAVARGIDIVFVSVESGLFVTVGVRARSATTEALGLLSLLSGLGSGQAPNEAINAPDMLPWVDLLADKLLVGADLGAVFNPSAIAKLRPDPIEFVTPRSARLKRPTGRWPAGAVFAVSWEVEEALYCTYLSKSCWVDRASLDVV